MEVRVQCYSGYKADERPLRFCLGGREIAVRTIVDRWFGGDHDYFKVLGEDGHIYLLRHDRRQDQWDLTLFRSADSPSIG